ncbi:hypothetical protein DRQ53_03610 [bacterium]|nr:MAG: hypothetical protein DRQ32_01755 [bacterium]RKZ17422.1 MAG: hypothetical protein DRQ53_03610 [bacterium]
MNSGINLARTPFCALLAVIAICCLGACEQEAREVTTASDLAFACYEDGTGSIERFQLEKGRQCFIEALEHDPDFSMAWAQLAIVQRQLGEHEKAQDSITRAYTTRTNASEVESLYIARLHALFQRDSEEADAVWETLRERYPDHPWVLRLRAEFAKADHDFETAHACYDRLLELDPDAVAVHNLKGYLYLSQGEYDEAVQSLQRYAYYTEDDDNPQANPHDSLGEAYLYIGRYDEAIEEFKAALQIDPAFMWSARNLSTALSITGQNRAAVKVLKHIQPLFKERQMMSWWHMTRSEIALRAEDWPGLLELTTADIERLSADDEHERMEYELFARYARTMALLESGNLATARESLLELGAVAQRLHDSKSAGKYQRTQQMLEVHEAMMLSRFSRAEGTPAEGIPRLETAMTTASLSPHELAWPAYELAQAYLEAGQPESSASTAGRILESTPTSPSLNFMAAKAWARAGDRDRALQHLQTFLDVMRNADAGNRQVEEATSLLQRLVPRS